MKERLCPLPLLFGCLLAAGCMTARLDRDRSPHPPAPPPRVPRTIAPEVRVAFQQARADWRRAERSGWRGDACDRVARAFERAGQAADEHRQPLAAAWYDAALAQRRCSHDDRAEALLRRALRADPRHGPSRVQIGLIELGRGRSEAAFRAFQEATSVAPQTAEAWINLAILQRRRGRAADLDEAEQNLRRALAVDAASMPAFHELAMLYVAESADRPERLRLADIVCRQATRLDPRYAPIVNAWGLVAVRQHDPIAAMARFGRARELDPRSFDAHMNFGSLALAYRGYADAEEALRRARTLRPDSYEARLGLGAALRGLGRTHEAEQEYAGAITLDPRRPEAYFNLGLLYQDHRSGTIAELQSAVACYRAFRDRVGQRSDLTEQTAEARRRSRNAEDAVQAIASVRGATTSSAPDRCPN